MHMKMCVAQTVSFMFVIKSERKSIYFLKLFILHQFRLQPF